MEAIFGDPREQIHAVWKKANEIAENAWRHTKRMEPLLFGILWFSVMYWLDSIMELLMKSFLYLL